MGINPESIKQVQEISRIISEELSRTLDVGGEIEMAVLNWWKNQKPHTEIKKNTIPFPDFIITDPDGRRAGLEIKYSEYPEGLSRQLRMSTFRSESALEEQNLREIVYTLAVPFRSYISLNHEIRTSKFPPKFRFILGIIQKDSDEETIYVPRAEYP